MLERTVPRPAPTRRLLLVAGLKQTSWLGSNASTADDMTQKSVMTTTRRTTGTDVFVALLLSPFYAAWGIVVLVGGLLWLARRVEGAQAALGSTIRCAHGHENATTGRFECGGCRATYVGWVGRCPMCGAGAAWMSCSICSVSILLPWER